jgi:hypothetical protein
LKYLSIALIAAFALSACGNKKKTMDAEDAIEEAVEAAEEAAEDGAAKQPEAVASKPDYFLSIEKTVCFGTCPVYVMEVNGKGKMKLNAKRHLKISGNFRGKMSDADFGSVKSQTDDADWKSYKSEYLVGVSDIPSTILRFSYAVGDTTTVRFEGREAPEELQILAKTLEGIQERTSWLSFNLD